MRATPVIGILLVAPCAYGQVRSVTLQPPARDFGYFSGAVIRSTAVIEVGPGTVLDQGSLPYAGPMTMSVDLRSITLADDAVPGGRRMTIHTEYQIFDAPDEVSRVDVPGYQLAFAQGSRRLTAAVPAFGVAISPFRHDLLQTIDPAMLRPDHPPDRVDGSSARLECLVAGAVALLAAACLAVLGGLPWVRHSRAPFARVARLIRRGKGDADGKDALLLLHRAFDETAGERVMAEDIDRFLEKAPRFARLRAEIVAFFALSRDCFFGTGNAAAAPAREALSALCRELARAERR